MHGASPAMSDSMAARVFANTLSNTLLPNTLSNTLCWNTRVTIADAGVGKTQRHREKTLITQHRSVRRWWWQDQTGKWIITLRDGIRVLPVNAKTPSIEVGDKDQLPTVLLALIEAVKAGELDAFLKQAVERQKR